MEKYVAECTGTFALVFFGTGPIVVNDLTGGEIGHLGICLTLGMIVTVMFYTFRSISGAHINPTVSVAFAVVGCFKSTHLLRYSLAQTIGTLLASI